MNLKKPLCLPVYFNKISVQKEIDTGMKNEADLETETEFRDIYFLQIDHFYQYRDDDGILSDKIILLSGKEEYICAIDIKQMKELIKDYL